MENDGRTKPIPSLNKTSNVKTEKSEDLCLFRAKLGNKKISTVVHAKEVNKFHLAYAQVLKVNMDNLKKRERKTAETKFKSTHKAKKEY
ncbi:unnamed protein product [Dracunculus medinensis]|uniref:Signal recognition particle 14 kDa protein n=1 Tax=Dracunculus medinensis TaxID=318479 RepID=A0A0N4U0T7_DRAME|nr:unnamed protein product [Dracunculus medinensis]